jgi:5-methylcytosine-specific restriction endonuclease McrA
VLPWYRPAEPQVSTLPKLFASSDKPYDVEMAKSRSRKARAARRRKARMDSVEYDLTNEQWTVIQEAWGGCAYCGTIGKPLQRDCVLALSRGGRYTLQNIVPACGGCNTSKCSEEVTHWLRRKRLNESSFLLRYSQIKKALAAQFSSSED